MERKKEDLELKKPVIQRVIDSGRKNNVAVFLLTKNYKDEDVKASVDTATRLSKELSGSALRNKFEEFKEKLHLTGVLSFEKQQRNDANENERIPFVIRKSKGKEKVFIVSADGDMDDSIGDTLEIEGPLSKTVRNNLRRMAKNMRETDVAIDRAIANGNPELAESLTNQWNTQRGDMMMYLRRSKIRVCPMRMKDKEKSIDRAAHVEYKQEKNKGVERPKTHGKSRELERVKNTD